MPTIGTSPSTLRALSPEAFVLETNAPAAAELFLHTLPDGRTLLQLINLTGWNGMTMERRCRFPIFAFPCRVNLTAFPRWTVRRSRSFRTRTAARSCC